MLPVSTLYYKTEINLRQAVAALRETDDSFTTAHSTAHKGDSFSLQQHTLQHTKAVRMHRAGGSQRPQMERGALHWGEETKHLWKTQTASLGAIVLDMYLQLHGRTGQEDHEFEVGFGQDSEILFLTK